MKRWSLWAVVTCAAYACGVAGVSGSAATGKSPSSFVRMQGSARDSCCEISQSMVFFDDRNSHITAEAEENLVHVLIDYRKSRSTAMKLVGYTGESGKVENSQALSRRRADAVKMWMVAHGVPAAAITTELRAIGPGIAEIDGVREPQNRRIEISFKEPK